MNKIVNWTIGSFFRTIGRIIAYIGIGYLITLLISNSDFRLDELFLIRAKADSFHYAYDTWLYKEKTYNTRLPSIEAIGSDNYYGYTWSNLYGINQELGFYHYKYDVSNYDKIRYYYYFNNGSQINNSPSSEVSIYARADTENSSGTAQYNACTTHAVSGSSQYGYIECPLVDGAYKLVGVTIFVQMESSETTNYRFGINPNITFIEENNQSNSDTILNNINSNIQAQTSQQHQDSVNTQNAITNQTQQQQQQHEELMDDNTTQAEDEATDFFEEFTVPDVGGLSAIITAPLNTIRSLLNSTCTPLILPLPFVNENLTLPCLTTIYTQHFGAFFTLYQTIILAIVAYRCIRSIFFDIHGFTDPSDDRIEVMDL